MELKKILLWFISFIFTYNGALSLNILGVFPYPGKSHFFGYEPYLRELASRGHNLTVISYFPQQNFTKNYHDISLAGQMPVLETVIPVYRSYWSVLQSYLFIYEIGIQNCKVMLSDKGVQNLWKSKETFDLVVTEQFNSDCSLGLAYKLSAPVVGMTLHVPMPWHYKRFGVQFNPSYMAFSALEGGTKPTLYQRIERVIFHNLCNILYKYTCQRVNQNQLQQYFDTPPLEDLARDIKIWLFYTNFVVPGSPLFPSNVIEVGGFHVPKPKELPKDLKDFIEQSEHGVIYISFGTMVQAASTPKDKLQAIVGAISKRPQRVVWKWDEKTLPGSPENVYVSDWLPQNDILAHPKVLAFFSHCGLLGITESIHYGVPMICMPVFGDQPVNADSMEERGLGVTIQIRDLTEKTLSQKIDTVLNPEFRRIVKELSKVWHDRPMTAMDSAVYWTEFAARTKNFTFSGPAASVPLYQYLCLDIIAATVCTSVTVIVMLKCIYCHFQKLQTPTKIKIS